MDKQQPNQWSRSREVEHPHTGCAVAPFPPFGLLEHPNHVLVDVFFGGCCVDDLRVLFLPKQLRVEGRCSSSEQRGQTFSRTVRVSIDGFSTARAVLRDGVLTVKLKFGRERNRGSMKLEALDSIVIPVIRSNLDRAS